MAAPLTSLPKVPKELLASFPAPLRAKIEEAAAWKGMSIGDFIAAAVGKEAERIIEKERIFELSREDAETISALLENLPKPNAALRKAAKLHKRDNRWLRLNRCRDTTTASSSIVASPFFSR